MAKHRDTVELKARKSPVFGRSPYTGRYVLAPVASKKATISDSQIAAAVKSVLEKKK
jgi:hypothetical protein